MSIITKMLIQDAVYWPPTGTDENGHPTLGTAVEVTVRWEKVVKELINTAGLQKGKETQMSQATVYVSQDVLVGGVLMLGALTSSVDTDDPKSNDDAWEILQFEKLPTLRGNEFLRTVYL